MTASNPERFVDLDPVAWPGGPYHLLNSVIVPRPIAWVSTRSSGGNMNVAPHSYAGVFSPNPPIIGFVSVGMKDTIRNAAATGDFVVNIADLPLLERMNLTAADFPSDVSEFTWAGLTPAPSDLVTSPRVGEAPISLEARVVEIREVANTGNYLALGEVVRAHVAERVIEAGRVSARLLQPVARLGGTEYATLGDVFAVNRPSWQGLLQSGAQPMDPAE